MRRVVAATLGFALVLVATAAGLALGLYRELDRVDVDLTTLPNRPSEQSSTADVGALDVGIIGTVDGRLLSLMVLHVDGDRRGARVVSLVVQAARGKADPTTAGPTSSAGVSRAAEELEARSGVRLDHVAVFDWRLVSRLVDRLGGVDVRIDPTAVEDHWQEWVRVRPDLVSDFIGATAAQGERKDSASGRRRALRQLALLDSVVQLTLHQELGHDPVGMYRLLHMVAGEVMVDDGWSAWDMTKLLASLRHLRSRDIVYEAVPPVMGR